MSVQIPTRRTATTTTTTTTQTVSPTLTLGDFKVSRFRLSTIRLSDSQHAEIARLIADQSKASTRTSTRTRYPVGPALALEEEEQTDEEEHKHHAGGLVHFGSDLDQSLGHAEPVPIPKTPHPVLVPRLTQPGLTYAHVSRTMRAQMLDLQHDAARVHARALALLQDLRDLRTEHELGPI